MLKQCGTRPFRFRLKATKKIRILRRDIEPEIVLNERAVVIFFYSGHVERHRRGRAALLTIKAIGISESHRCDAGLLLDYQYALGMVFVDTAVPLGDVLQRFLVGIPFGHHKEKRPVAVGVDWNFGMRMRAMRLNVPTAGPQILG